MSEDDLAYPPLTNEQAQHLQRRLNEFSWVVYVRRLQLLLNGETPLYVDASVNDGHAGAGGAIVAITANLVVQLAWAEPGTKVVDAAHTRAEAVSFSVRSIQAEASWRPAPGVHHITGEPDEVTWVLDIPGLDQPVRLPLYRYGDPVPASLVSLAFERLTTE